jgi:hypothetical protein
MHHREQSTLWCFDTYVASRVIAIANTASGYCSRSINRNLFAHLVLALPEFPSQILLHPSAVWLLAYFNSNLLQFSPGA